MMLAKAAWETEHAVETDASPDFAWSYWTDVANWDDPPARFEFDGPFAPGARGLTRLPGQEPIQWIIREVTPGQAATIEIPVDGAAVAFEWKFAGLADGRTRLTQRMVLRGERAAAYLEHAKILAANMPGGMKKMAAAIACAAGKQVGGKA
jgi:Polyketide cyclase / dehydrase and lipid transport